MHLIARMLVAWTTVSLRADADRLASQAVDLGLAACVQIEGPLTSHYRWGGAHETTKEFRLTFKVLPEQSLVLQTWVHAHHPYEVPEWIVIEAAQVAEKYLSWARTTLNHLPL